MKLNSVTDVDRAGLCIGCGLCVGLFSDQQPKMHIGTDGFLHPKNTFDKGTWKEICQVCPGMQYCSSENIRAPEEMLWGPLVDAKIGHACDDMVRWLGSSGGGISSVLIYLLEKHIIDAVIQTGPDLNDPLRTATFLNFSKEDIIRCSSSRYCPSSPLDSIGIVLSKGIKTAFVGRPCDVSALRRYLTLHPEYNKNIPVLISFFCAATPSYNATNLLLNRLQVTPDQIKSFRYRGKGWPGFATAETLDGTERKLSYEKSWGEILSKHSHFRCKVCPDGIGLFADIVFADAWVLENGKPVFKEDLGRNLVLIRTRTGLDILNNAAKNGYFKPFDFNITDLNLIQPSQAQKRSIVGARLFALRFCGIPYPKCSGLHVYRNLKNSKPSSIIKNFLGTIRRVVFPKLKQYTPPVS